MGHDILEKDVYERYLQSLKSRKFESSSEGTQLKRLRWVNIPSPPYYIHIRVDERIYSYGVG